jgi:hypothetical protein
MLKRIDFTTAVNNTAGVRSLSKAEIADSLVAQEKIENSA